MRAQEKGTVLMKKFVFLLATSAALAACSAQEGDSDAAMEADTMSAEVADLGGAPTGPVYTEEAGQTLALSGYDAVSYFEGEAPSKGSEAFKVRYQGYDYHFATAENASKFEAEPAKYAPQYGGYCAWAMGAKDALAPGNPEVYKVVDGKLYLNFNTDVAAMWEEDIPGFIKTADVNYPNHSPDEHYKTN